MTDAPCTKLGVPEWLHFDSFEDICANQPRPSRVTKTSYFHENISSMGYTVSMGYTIDLIGVHPGVCARRKMLAMRDFGRRKGRMK